VNKEIRFTSTCISCHHVLHYFYLLSCTGQLAKRSYNKI
jgi:hypothetical protein